MRQGTPRDDAAPDWDDEQNEYGTPVSPAEWDDYASEQSAPVPPPPPTAETEPATDDDPYASVPGQEPEEAEEYRSNDPDVVEDAPAGDTDDDGMEPERTEPVSPLDQPHGRDSDLVHADTADADALYRAEREYRAPEAAAEDTDHEDSNEALADDEPAAETEQETAGLGDDPDATAVHPVVEADDDAETQERTRLAPLAAAPAAVAAAGAVPADIYRHDTTATHPDSAEQTAVLDQAAYDGQDHDEDERLAAQLEAERRARNERLGVMDTSGDDELRDPVVHWRRDNDRFLPSLGLFLLRLATAAVVGVIGYQVLTDIDATSDFLSQTMIPEPRLVSWILGFTLGVLALLLVIGMLQRVVGVVLLVAAVGSLAFIRWGSFSPFVEGREGFLGDRTLLLAVIGFLLLALGGGAWGVDGAYRRGRARAKAEKLA